MKRRRVAPFGRKSGAPYPFDEKYLVKKKTGAPTVPPSDKPHVIWTSVV
jgi:hypothetical protein